MAPQPQAEAPLSEVSRLVGVFVDPKRTLADVLLRPRWYVPVILLTLCSLAVVVTYSQHVGWDHIVRQSMEQSSRTQNMTPEQREQAVAMGVKFGSVIGYIQGFLGPTIGVLIVAGVLMFIANGMLAAQLRYAQMLGIVAYSFLPGVLSAILIVAVMFMKSPEDFDIRNPLAFNPGAFLNPDSTPKWLISLASSFDLFSFWSIALLAIGISCAGRKITFSKALGAVLIPWALWVVIKTGWTAMFS
jgi:hypothetical protein